MSIQIKEVLTNKELKQFVAFQFDLYKNNKYWVPPLCSDEFKSLKKETNPAFDFCDVKCWLAYKDGKIAGRIAGIINKRYNDKWNKKAVRFGWFDFIEDNEVSLALLQTLESWAKELGMTSIHGPLGFTDLDGEGMLVEGFEELSTYGSLYNYPYYQKSMDLYGYEKETDWVEFQVAFQPVIIDKIKRIAEIALQRNNLKVLKVKKAKELIPYGKQIFYLINEAYKNLYGFVELTDKQIDIYIKQYLGFVIPEFVPVVLDANNQVVAFGISMPSLSVAFQKCNGSLFPFGFIHVMKAMKNNKGADLYLTAVKPEMQNKGINAILMYETNKVFVKNKIEFVETNRELEGNEKVQAQWKFFNTRLHKRRRCYGKSIL
ncbi:MAG: hypothetical protein GXX85_10485 [Ignavibacteria bacterium]|nr:hypothetical protein [Ignavibacteria bacterium]